MAVAAAADVEEVFYVQSRAASRLKAPRSRRGRCRKSLVVGDHQHFFRRGEAGYADGVEFALGAITTPSWIMMKSGSG